MRGCRGDHEVDRGRASVLPGESHAPLHGVYPLVAMLTMYIELYVMYSPLPRPR